MSKRKFPKDFLEICRRHGRDPESVRDPERYMNAYHRAGEKHRRYVAQSRREKK